MTVGTLGVAIAKRTGERRLLSLEEYHRLESWSEARWEFFTIRREPATGTAHLDDLVRWGLRPGGPTTIAGDSREVQPGEFVYLNGDGEPKTGGTAMATQAQHEPFVTPEEYLAMDRAADSKSEYYDGVIVAMAGASEPHNLIVGNIIVALGIQLRGGSCRVYPSDLRVWNPITRSHTFPDVVVVCGESRLNGDGENDVLLNPTLLIEVLSPSTEAKDRGGKAESFRRLDSLQEYLLVSQFEPHIEHYRRYDERQWILTEATQLADALELGSIGCTLALSDIYQNVAVSPAEDDAAHTDSDHG